MRSSTLTRNYCLTSYQFSCHLSWHSMSQACLGRQRNMMSGRPCSLSYKTRMKIERQRLVGYTSLHTSLSAIQTWKTQRRNLLCSIEQNLIGMPRLSSGTTFFCKIQRSPARCFSLSTLRPSLPECCILLVRVIMKGNATPTLIILLVLMMPARSSSSMHLSLRSGTRGSDGIATREG